MIRSLRKVIPFQLLVISLASLAIAMSSGCGPRQFSFSQTTHELKAPLVDVQASRTASGTDGKCDIVAVVDNSGSMRDNQTALAQGALVLSQSDFFKNHSQLQFIVLTTDSYLGLGANSSVPADRIVWTDGRDGTAAQAGQKLATALQPGTNGNGSERYYDSVVRFLNDQEGWNGSTLVQKPSALLRTGACFFVFVITDELWQSPSGTPAGLHATIDNFLRAKTPGVTPSWATSAIYDRRVDTGDKFMTFVNLVANGSFTRDILASNWADNFFQALGANISTQIQKTTMYSVQLPGAVDPDPSRLGVYIESAAGVRVAAVPSTKWELSADRTIVFLDQAYVDALATSTDESLKVVVEYFLLASAP